MYDSVQVANRDFLRNKIIRFSFRHFYFTIPVVFILFFLHAPMCTSKDRIKLICLAMITVLYFTPWITYLAYHKNFTLKSSSSLFTVGYAFGEVYFLHLLQTLITAYFHLHISKVTLPILHMGKFGQSSRQRFFASYFVPLICFCLIYWGWQIAIPDTRTFYIVSKIRN